MTGHREIAVTGNQDVAGRRASTIVAKETSNHIVEVATRLIRQRGYRDATVAKIAKELGLSPASVYRFYRSKDELRYAVCLSVLDGCHYSAVLAAAKFPAAASARVGRFIEAQHSFMVNTIVQDPRIHELILSGIDQGWDAMTHFVERGERLIAGMIRDGISAKLFADQDPDKASRSLVAATASLWHPTLVAYGLGKLNRERPEQLIDFVLRALK